MSRWRKLFGRIDAEDIPDDPEADLAAVFGEQTSDPRTPAAPATLYELLSKLGESLTDGIDTFTLVREDLGELRSLAGEFVICDPLVPGAEPPVVTAQRGIVSIVRLTIAASSQVGMAMMALSNGKPVTWRLLGKYGVDSGTSCFADPAALEALSRRSAAYYAQDGELSGEEPLVDVLSADDAVLYAVDAEHSIAAFRSGVGDGVYDAWLGVEAGGASCVVMTSFDNIAEETVAT